MTFSAKTQQSLKRNYGPWALITGASSGIGKELASRLAEAGLNVVLSARRAALLEQLSEELTAKYGIEARVVTADLSQEKDIHHLFEATADLQIGLLVANAGFGTSGKFLHADIKQEINMLDVNCKALLKCTHHYAQQMMLSKKGGIILLSSMVGFQGVPNAAHYAATKAYVQSLGEALHVELKPNGIDVLAAAPGPVMSGFSERANMKMGNVLQPSDVAIPMLKALGKRSTVLPGTLTKVLVYSLRTVPRWAKVRIMNMVMGGMTAHQA
jgi:short-subunit dehydrogenase